MKSAWIFCGGTALLVGVVALVGMIAPPTWTYAIGSVLLVGELSLMSVFALSFKPRTLAAITRVLLCVGAGAMLGNALIHLIPESFEPVAEGKISGLTVSLLVSAGFLFQFILEKGLNFRCHKSDGCHHAPEQCTDCTCGKADAAKLVAAAHDDHGCAGHDHEPDEHEHPAATGCCAEHNHGENEHAHPTANGCCAERGQAEKEPAHPLANDGFSAKHAHVEECVKHDIEVGTHEHSSGGHAHIHPTGHMSWIAHMADNFKDGYLIGTAYLTGIPVGIATTISILGHEPFLELGGYATQTSAGIRPVVAILLNLISAFVALLGTLLVLALGSWIPSLPHYLTPLGAGLALYLACQLLAMIQKETDRKKAIIQVSLMLLGFGALVIAKIVEIAIGG